MPKHNDSDKNKHDRSLDGTRVAILLTNGFEQIEMTDPRQALEEAGAECF
jgi:protease I